MLRYARRHQHQSRESLTSRRFSRHGNTDHRRNALHRWSGRFLSRRPLTNWLCSLRLHNSSQDPVLNLAFDSRFRYSSNIGKKASISFSSFADALTGFVDALRLGLDGPATASASTKLRAALAASSLDRRSQLVSLHVDGKFKLTLLL